MPRHPHLFIPGATYHVYFRVARGEFVFDDDNEAIDFVEVFREVSDLDGWTMLIQGSRHRRPSLQGKELRHPVAQPGSLRRARRSCIQRADQSPRRGDLT